MCSYSNQNKCIKSHGTTGTTPNNEVCVVCTLVTINVPLCWFGSVLTFFWYILQLTPCANVEAETQVCYVQPIDGVVVFDMCVRGCLFAVWFKKFKLPCVLIQISEWMHREWWCYRDYPKWWGLHHECILVTSHVPLCWFGSVLTFFWYILQLTPCANVEAETQVCYVQPLMVGIACKHVSWQVWINHLLL